MLMHLWLGQNSCLLSLAYECNTSLDNHIVFEYLLHIQALVDALTTIYDVVPPYKQLDVILEGLPKDYESIVSFINNKFNSLSVNKVEMLLLAHEARLDKFKKVVTSINAQAYVAQVSAIDQHVVPHSFNTNNTRSGRFGRGGHADTRGGRGRYYGIECQWYSTPWNIYHYQKYGFPTPNDQYVRPALSSFAPSRPSHLTTPASTHAMIATIDPYSFTNHWYLDLDASHHVTNVSHNI
ncbi:hypothetical protein CR513_19979, partial [Mucuna pruriens]